MQAELIIGVILAIVGTVLSVVSTLLLSYFKDMKNNIKNMSDSMVQMNVKLEKVITDQSWHKEEMGEIKSRLSYLESHNAAQKR